MGTPALEYIDSATNNNYSSSFGISNIPNDYAYLTMFIVSGTYNTGSNPWYSYGGIPSARGTTNWPPTGAFVKGHSISGYASSTLGASLNWYGQDNLSSTYAYTFTGNPTTYGGGAGVGTALALMQGSQIDIYGYANADSLTYTFWHNGDTNSGADRSSAFGFTTGGAGADGTDDMTNLTIFGHTFRVGSTITLYGWKVS